HVFLILQMLLCYWSVATLLETYEIQFRFGNHSCNSSRFTNVKQISRSLLWQYPAKKIRNHSLVVRRVAILNPNMVLREHARAWLWPANSWSATSAPAISWWPKQPGQRKNDPWRTCAALV